MSGKNQRHALVRDAVFGKPFLCGIERRLLHVKGVNVPALPHLLRQIQRVVPVARRRVHGNIALLQQAVDKIMR